MGSSIEDVEILHPKPINLAPAQFLKSVKGATFIDFIRKGKILQCKLSTGDWLVVHLKMTGQLIGRKGSTQVGGGHPLKVTHLPNPWTRLILHCSKGITVYFNDVRIFGWVHHINEQARRLLLKSIGPDAFLDPPVSKDIAAYAARYPNRTLKHMLLDQAFIAGIGNIYADEICYFAGIKPDRKIGKLQCKEFEKIHDGIPTILTEAVACRGTTFRDFVDGSGRSGGYHNFLKAYGRGSKDCLRCGAQMIKTVIAQRGTTYCSRCQV